MSIHYLKCSKTAVQKASQAENDRFIFEQWSLIHIVPLVAFEYKNENKQIQGFVILRVVVCYKSL